MKLLGDGPAGIAVGGLVMGFQELNRISQAVTENLTELPMPDFELDKVSATTLGLTEQQKLNLVERILNHQMTMQQAWDGLAQRQAMLESQMQNVRYNSM